MKLLRNKIIILVSIAALVSIGIITFIHLFFGSSVEKIKRNYVETQVQLLQNNIKVNSASATRSLLYLASNSDIRPCEIAKYGLPESLGYRLGMAGFTFLAITDPRFNPTATYPADKKEILAMIPSDSHIFNKALSDGRVTIYYQWKNDSLFEILTTSIPGCTGLRSDSIGAWIIAGRYINEEFSSKLILKMPGKITIFKDPQASGSDIHKETNTYSSTLPLYGWNNFPEASIRIETQPEIMQLLTSQQKTLLFVQIIMVAAFLLFIYFYLNRYYILPMRLVSLALKQKDPEYIRMISDSDPDFNSLQTMLINVFNQERMLAELMKRRSSEHMNSFHAAILSRINEAVYATDHKGIITYWNKAAEDLYHTSEKDAISQVSQVLIKNHWKNTVEEKHQIESLNTNGVWQGILNQELPDGSEIIVEASVTCLYDNSSNLIGHLTIVRKPYL